MLRHAFEPLEGSNILCHIVGPPPPSPPIFYGSMCSASSNSLILDLRSTKDIFNIIPWLQNLAKAVHVSFTSRVSSSLGYWMVQGLHNKCNNIKIGARPKTLMKINILKTNFVYSLDLFLAPEFSSFTFFSVPAWFIDIELQNVMIIIFWIISVFIVL